MINVDDLQKSFLLSWAKTLMIEKDEKWKQIPTEMMSRLGKSLCCFSSDLSVKYFKGLGLIKNTFWRKVLSCWLDNKQKWSTVSVAKIASEKQCLWNNSNISRNYQLSLPRPRIDIFKTSISFSRAFLWNNLPLTVRSCQSLSSFKGKTSCTP